MSTLQRVIEHFGLTVANYGYLPGETPKEADLRRAVKAGQAAGLILTTAQVAAALDAQEPAERDQTATAVAERVMVLVKDAVMMREGMCHDDPDEGAEMVIAVAALGATDRMSPKLLAALVCMEAPPES